MVMFEAPDSGIFLDYHYPEHSSLCLHECLIVTLSYRNTPKRILNMYEELPRNYKLFLTIQQRSNKDLVKYMYKKNL